MIIISGVLEFADRSHRDAAAAGSVDLQAATRTAEPGCEAYWFAPDPVDDTHLLVFERWRDAASLEAHFDHENYQRMREYLHGAEMTGSSTRKYRIDAEGPVYNADRVATAEF